MPASFQEILNSRMFRFVVGKNTDNNPAEFFVHEKAISQCSDSLYVLLSKGDFRESQEGCARWDDVSKETFERFAQFAYTGDYSVPEPVLAFNRIKPAEEEVSITPPQSRPLPTLASTWGFDEPIARSVIEFGEEEISWGARKKDKKKRVKIEEEIAPEQKPDSITRKDEYFRNLSFPAPPHNNYEESCTVMFFDRNLSYSKVFIGHASLYILGDLYCIDLLKDLALSKLYRMLCVFQFDSENAEDVVDLARYVYSEKCEGGGFDQRLRKLVCQYVATKTTLLFGDEGFKDLLKEGGLFVLHLFEFVVSGVNK